MVRGFLVCVKQGQPSKRLPIGSSITIGRSMDCGCVIDDAAASRRHVRVTQEGGRYLWKDLNSTNGTQVNGALMLEGVLNHGDELQIGETVIRFEIEETQEETEPEDSTTIFKETMVNWQPGGEGEGKGEEHSENLLRAVYTIMNEIASNYDPCPLVDRILQTTMRAIDAHRGAIAFAATDSDELAPCPVCKLFHVIQGGEVTHLKRQDLRISKTVVHRVLKRGESLLYQDTDQDSEFNIAESIRSLRLRSIICAPLRGKMGIFGILYIDSDRPRQQYSHADMLLSTAVGNSAGLALENARMHSEILEKQRTDQDLQHAWQIQQGFLIREWPQGDGRYLVYGDMRPAKIVGGDFYDFVQPDADHVGILIGDVSGKGVSASLTMAQLLAEFRLQARNSESPGEVLQALNQSMCSRGVRGTFCTLSYVIVDLGTGKVLCASAGHHPAITIGKGDLRIFGNATGPPVGVLPEARWEDTESKVSTGESILLYTDGIVEARTSITHIEGEPLSEEFGMENLIRVVGPLHKSSPREIIEELNRSVLAYCAPSLPHDDCTLIAVKYLG